MPPRWELPRKRSGDPAAILILLMSAGAGLGMAVLMALGFRRPPGPDDG